ncbi:LPXTG cell wall anchor domain-containing protein [Pedobacter jamesrossensis]|uniref:LPXTG cell wall anchor domain-containing protein n=1 Tax=Pedobacter jamesrossensis TaxID=1908238 RepID=A0ABV8NKP5_9SPHI
MENMNVNYLVIGGIVLILLILLLFFLKRNHKDEKEFEKDVIQNELETEKHGDDKT